MGEEAALPPDGSMSPSAPPAPRPVVLRPPGEDTVLGRDLRLNGAEGSIRLERTGRDELKAQITLVGSKISRPTEACSVKIGGGAPVPVSALGKPEGLARYEIQAPGCPMVADVLDGGLFVSAPKDVCEFKEADCAVEPFGVWGPDAASLIPKARDLEQARAAADRAVRENYKALAHRATPQSLRPIVAEQAGFSAERETVCRSYHREGVHGFCNTRYTEGRAVMLAARLGLISPVAEAQPGERRPRSRPTPAPIQPAQQPLDPYFVR